MLTATPLLVLRLYELAQILGTVFGGYLVIRYGRSTFLAGSGQRIMVWYPVMSESRPKRAINHGAPAAGTSNPPPASKVSDSRSSTLRSQLLRNASHSVSSLGAPE